MIVTNDDRLAQRCWSIHNCGRRPDRAWYEHFTIGGNYRLGEFQGAVLNAQWDRFEAQAETREQNGKSLAARLGRLSGVYPQARDGQCTRHGYHLFCLRLDPDELGISRAMFLDALSAEGIPNSAGYPMPLYKQVMFTDREYGPYTGGRSNDTELENRQTHCPNCETICTRQGVWLLQEMMLGRQKDMDDIVVAFEKVHAHRQTLASA